MSKRWVLIMGCVTLAWAAQLTVLVERKQSARILNPPLVYHNVRIVERFDNYRFRMAMQDPDTKQWNEFGFKFCETYLPTKEMTAGTTLTLLKYQEDNLNSCGEIKAVNLGYILLRGENNEPVISANR